MLDTGKQFFQQRGEIMRFDLSDYITEKKVQAW